MKFIDLFAGLGGFHLALSNLGHKCVFACEIENFLREHYKKNFNFLPSGDITKVKLKDIPSHDILCAGFPCQPFSKAGNLNGFDHKIAGKMFFHLVKIIKHHKPKYLFLENVPNLLSHNRGRTWNLMKKKISKLNYEIDYKILSPVDYNIPQTRDRLYIVAKIKNLSNFIWPKKSLKKANLKKYLVSKPQKKRILTAKRSKVFMFWKKFLKKIPKGTYLPNPLWTMEFGATYPYENISPLNLSLSELRRFKGSFGKELVRCSKGEISNLIPKYARLKVKKFPLWKINMIKKSRKFYEVNKKWLDKIVPELIKLEYHSYQKLEWNCQGEEFNLRKKIVSFRGSGVRIRRSINAPTLISSTTSQVPYLPWKKRYLSHEESLKIQGFKGLKSYPKSEERFTMTIGNAVNVSVISKIAKNLLSQENVNKK